MFIYAADAKAINLYPGEIIDSQRDGELVETPEVVERVTLDAGWIYFGFEHCVRRVPAHSNLKTFTQG